MERKHSETKGTLIFGKAIIKLPAIGTVLIRSSYCFNVIIV